MATNPATGATTQQVTVVSGTTKATTTGATSTASGNTAVQGDPTNGLTGASRDAAVALIDLFKTYGLESLAPRIVEFLRQGFSADTISIELQSTPEYKTRFAANDARVKKGLPALSPAEYLATERSYRSLLAAAGVPVGFYDSTSDFQKFLENDVSPTELKSRIDVATEAVFKAPKETTDYFKQWYSEGDMIAYALDPATAAPLIEKRIRAAEAAAVGRTQGVGLGQATAEAIGATGAGIDQIQQGLGFVGRELPAASKLADIYGGDPMTADDLVREVFQNDATVSQKRNRLASQERATFSNKGGVTQASLSKDGGQV